MNAIEGLRTLAANLSGRIDATESAMREAAVQAGIWITGDGRVAEQDLAQLLGMSPATLANRRREGRAPPSYRMGVRAGSRVSYRLREVAQWIESTRE